MTADRSAATARVTRLNAAITQVDHAAVISLAAEAIVAVTVTVVADRADGVHAAVVPVLMWNRMAVVGAAMFLSGTALSANVGDEPGQLGLEARAAGRKRRRRSRRGEAG